MRVMTPICLTCQREMRVKKNDQRIVTHTAKDQPHQVWSGDAWVCGSCGAHVVTGFGRVPVAESHQESFGRATLGAVDIYPFPETHDV